MNLLLYCDLWPTEGISRSRKFGSRISLFIIGHVCVCCYFSLLFYFLIQDALGAYFIHAYILLLWLFSFLYVLSCNEYIFSFSVFSLLIVHIFHFLIKFHANCNAHSFHYAFITSTFPLYIHISTTYNLPYISIL